MPFLKISENHQTQLGVLGGPLNPVHVFQDTEINAINTALAAQRPLLITGEPGVGKSQLARAAAIELQRVYKQSVVDAHTEARDLLWQFDAVQRLADAQLMAATGGRRNKTFRYENPLEVKNYIHPGPLWWALNWRHAQQHAQTAPPAQAEGCCPENGCVLLIDEIDKAETDIPNSLLEALGENRFTPQGFNEAVAATSPAPLVIITTNEERALPDAFLRRCLVLNLNLPEAQDEFIEHLTKRGKAHFGKRLSSKVITEAAEQIYRDRENTPVKPKPGQAEFLDLLRALAALPAKDDEERLKTLKVIAEYVTHKQGQN